MVDGERRELRWRQARLLWVRKGQQHLLEHARRQGEPGQAHAGKAVKAAPTRKEKRAASHAAHVAAGKTSRSSRARA